jgi:NAD(P)-dependent dehydrogenase (short-subunit alcohol dehydrogenase family)
VTEAPDYPALLRQDGRVVAVVGAGNGMGLQAAHAFASVGARVVCVDIDGDRAAAAAEAVDGLAVVADVTDRADVRRAVAAAVETYGGLHVVVDIVGLAETPTALLEASDEQWERSIALNLGQCRLVLQEAGRAVVASGGGSMVFVSSITALTAAPRVSAYGAAKTALISLVRSAAVELGPLVRVNCVAPGRTLTPRVSAWLDEDRRAEIAARQPVGRMGTPADQAGVLLFLASDLAGYVTGQCLTVDGGYLLNLLNSANPGGGWPGEKVGTDRSGPALTGSETP